MGRVFGAVAVACAFLIIVDTGKAWSQDTPAAAATRKRLQTKISVDYKEIGTKEIFDDIKREMDNKVSFKIDNASGISNNSKMTVKADEQTLERILNSLCDKYDFGYVIMSKPKDRYDGWILLR